MTSLPCGSIANELSFWIRSSRRKRNAARRDTIPDIWRATRQLSNTFSAIKYISSHNYVSLNITVNLTYLFGLRGFAQLIFFLQKSQFFLDRVHPTHPHPIQTFFFFGNPSLTWTEHSNHNNQQLLANVYRQNTHGILLKNISTAWVRAIWDDCPKKIFRVRLGPTHPLPFSDFWNFSSLQSPVVTALWEFVNSTPHSAPVSYTGAHSLEHNSYD